MKRCLLAIVAPMLMLACCACGGQTVTLSGTGVAPKVPGLTVTPLSVAFGDVTTNTTATQSVQLASTGTAPVTVTALTVSGAEFSVSGLSIPATLQPAATAQLAVSFDPTIVGDATGSLTVVSNATTSPVQSVTITGTSVAPSYTVDLTWQAPASSPDPVVAYNVYRGAHGSGVYTLLSGGLTSLAYTDTTIVAGQSYDYIVESVDAQGVTSAPSNVYNAVIP